MFVYSILTRLQTGPSHLPLAMLNTNGRSVDVTSSGFSMWNSLHSSRQFSPRWRGVGKHANAPYKRIASLLANKTGEAYSNVIVWIRCKLSFALLRASEVCLRGSRGLRAPALRTSESPSVAVVEADIEPKGREQVQPCQWLRSDLPDAKLNFHFLILFCFFLVL